MDTPNLNQEIRFTLRADAILAYGCGHGCRVRAAGSGQAAELISIGQQWARIRLAAGRERLGHGDAVSLEPGLKPGLDLPTHIPARVAGRTGNELWLTFDRPLAVPLHDLQSSLDTCAAA
jgi:hypothetical protein